jgi:GxxExxY protein
MTGEDYRYEQLTHDIIKVFYETANELGSGFTENVYEAAMIVSLTDAGFEVRQSVALPVWFRGRQIAMFRADAIVERVVLLEFKAAASIEPWHEAQVLNYLRASDLEIGYVLNFGKKAEFKRLAFSNDRKKRAEIVEPT